MLFAVRKSNRWLCGLGAEQQPGTPHPFRMLCTLSRTRRNSSLLSDICTHHRCHHSYPPASKPGGLKQLWGSCVCTVVGKRYPHHTYTNQSASQPKFFETHDLTCSLHIFPIIINNNNCYYFQVIRINTPHLHGDTFVAKHHPYSLRCASFDAHMAVARVGEMDMAGSAPHPLEGVVASDLVQQVIILLQQLCSSPVYA